MKESCILLFVLSVAIFGLQALCHAATVGNPIDMDIPSKSAILREQVVDETLDGYEEKVKIKTSVDVEFVFDKNLNAPEELNNPDIEGRWYMAKLGTTVFNRIEPYIKLGTSELEVGWTQGNGTVKVDADSGFAWGGGIKGILYESEYWDVRLTGDVQYRSTEPDVEECSFRGVNIRDSGADFKIDEWQASLVLSKKYELPLRWQSVYIVPYTGFNISESNVDVKFTDPNNPALDYSLFEANNDEIYGFLLGLDIMLSLRSSFIFNVEARLFNEFALTLGGAMKF